MDADITNFSYQRQEKGSETDSEMSSCCCFLPKQCLLFKQRAYEGGCQGAPDYGHSQLFDARGGVFFDKFVATLFSFKI